MEVVVTTFKAHIEEDEETGAQTYGQAEDIDEGKSAMAPEGPECDLEVVGEHGFSDWLWRL
jgi:hypothetical protein